MTRMIGIRIICVAAAVILALASIFGVAKLTTDPAFYQKSIAALEEKQETVLELTAASTAASAAIGTSCCWRLLSPFWQAYCCWHF